MQVLIADKLDGDLDKPFIVVVGPLLLAFLVLILMSFSAKGGNKCELKECAVSLWTINQSAGDWMINNPGRDKR